MRSLAAKVGLAASVPSWLLLFKPNQKGAPRRPQSTEALYRSREPWSGTGDATLMRKV